MYKKMLTKPYYTYHYRNKGDYFLTLKG